MDRTLPAARGPGLRQGRPAGALADTDVLPRVSPLLLRAFRWYAARFVARHFHAVRWAGEVQVPDDLPLVVYCNHASWWDPMILLLLTERIAPGRRHYAPIDARALERYRLFKRLGFFGVEQHTRRGAVQFLRIGEAILNRPGSALWLTPEGRFVDVRDRSARFERGLGALAGRSSGAVFLPVALEYSFWEERLPEVLIRVGRPMVTDHGRQLDDRQWSRWFERSLRETQEQLSAAAVRRDVRAFRTVWTGTRGVNRIYDGWRALTAALRGEPFRREHGDL